MSFWLVVLFVSCVLATKGGCDFGDILSASQYRALINRINDKGPFADKLIVIAAFAANNTLGISSNQTVGILRTLGMSDDKLKAVNILQGSILTLDCLGIVNVLQTIGFSDKKLSALKILLTLANEANLKQFNETIVAEFGASSDKAAARKIIAETKSRSCLFGPANIPLFAFIIDVSGSMSETFKDSDGVTYSRLSYVQRDIKNVMNGTLKATQQFNIIQFSDRASAWKPGVVPATTDNIASAGVYVNNLRAAGGTYMLNALKLAFSDPKVLGVYFLSDGAPNDNPSQAVISFAESVKKPVHTIAFKAPVAGQEFLMRLANSTKGTFRNIVE